jgi:group I intron endonuclease
MIFFITYRVNFSLNQLNFCYSVRTLSSTKTNYFQNESDNSLSFPIKIEKSYNNLHLISTKNQIKSELKKLMGVYAFQHNESKNMYIGSSAIIHIRIYNHFINSNSNIYLQRAFQKYGLNNFTLHILEFYTFDHNLSIEDNRKLLIEREQYYLDFLFPKYNMAPIAGSKLGTNHSSETRLKMSQAKQGFIFSEDTIRKMSEASRGVNNSNYGKITSEETKIKIRKVLGNIIFVYSLENELLLTLPSGKVAAEYFKCALSTLMTYARSNAIFKDKYILSLKEILNWT